jgi:hypothetical protein
MAKPKPKTILTLTVDKMPGETEQQYAAWLLYCEAGSIEKLIRVWNKSGQLADEIGMEFVTKLAKVPAHSTLGLWSKRYRWPERRDLRLEKELVELKDKADRFIKKRKYLVTDLLISKMGKLQKQARTESTDVPEVRSLWEMHRTEFGEITGRSDVSHHINEAEQYPPTEDEKELGREIDELIKQHYDKKR